MVCVFSWNSTSSAYSSLVGSDVETLFKVLEEGIEMVRKGTCWVISAVISDFVTSPSNFPKRVKNMQRKFWRETRQKPIYNVGWPSSIITIFWNIVTASCLGISFRICMVVLSRYTERSTVSELDNFLTKVNFWFVGSAKLDSYGPGIGSRTGSSKRTR